MEKLFKELQAYLKDNFIPFSCQVHNNSYVFQIDEKKYELSVPNEDGRFFDESFCWDCDRTDLDGYIFNFGSVWYTLQAGNEKAVKLDRVKWRGKIQVEEEALLQRCFLGVHGPFELMNGSGSYKDWCSKAKWMGIESLGICEKGTLAGTLKFQTACEKAGIKPILGMEIPIQIAETDSRYTIKAFIKNEQGWINLLWINKLINVDSTEGYVNEKEVMDHKEGLIFIYDPKTIDFNNLPTEVWLNKENYYQLDPLEYKKEDRDEFYLKNLRKFYNTKMKPVLMSDAYYLEKEYASIRTKLNRLAGVMNYESDSQYFKNGEELWLEFSDLFKKNFDGQFEAFSAAMENLEEICDACNFTVETKQRHLPKYYMTPEESKLYRNNEEMFIELVYKGVEDHVDLLDEWGEDVVAERIEREIKVIREGDVIDYFLILRDIIKWGESQKFVLGSARGSSAGSLCSYLLGVTRVDPLKYGLLFERFLNEGRAKVSLPDVDSDFSSKDRPLIKEYMEQRFGVEQVCSVGTYTTFQLKAAITDLCRLEGVPVPYVKKITKRLGGEKEKTMEDFFRTACVDEELKEFTLKYYEVVNDTALILGQPKAASIHACAMMIFPDDKSMFAWAPVRKQKDMIVSEWEGGELDAAGFLKEDILGIEQLDKFEDILDLIEKNHGKRIDLYRDIPLDDPTVYEAMGKGFLNDVFHFGAKGLSSYCVQMKPKSIEELSDCAALYRPGTIENNFHNEYLLRRSGERDVEYHIGTEKILGKTYGIFCFQEQVMSLMNELAGMDLVTCDTARKAMGKKKIDVIQSLEEKFIDGYCSRYHVSEDYAKNFWNEIIKSSSYLFNKSHSIAYSINGYNSEWLKVHYPIEFWSVAFSRAKAEDIPFYVNEIQNSGNIEVRPVDINKSTINIISDIETNSMYWAFNSVDQVGDKAQAQLLEERNENGEYFSLEEFIDRQMFKGSPINKSVVENLIYSGAFDKIEGITDVRQRATLLEKYREIKKVKVDPTKDEYTLAKAKSKTNTAWWWKLQQKNKSNLAFFDYETLIEAYLRKSIGPDIPYTSGEDLRNWKEGKEADVAIGGYVLEIQERKSKKGNFCNLVIENNYEFIKVLVYPELFEDYGEFLRESVGGLLLLNGYVTYNKFHDSYVVQTSNYTEFIKMELT